MQVELILIYVFAVLGGLVLGSFYNVVIYRFQKGISIISPPSYCPCCKTPLQSADLIPFFSHLFLRGRCRYCRDKISFRYSAVELLSALLLAASFWRFGFSPELVKHFPLFSILLIVSAIDLDSKKIPNLFIGVIFAWALLWQLLSSGRSWGDAALGLLAGGGIALLIVLVSRGGMGGGDVKLLAALGFLTGWLDLLLLFTLAVLTGAAAGVILIVFGKKTGKTALPFGPFISLSYFIVIFWGSQIWDFYFSLV